MKCGRYYYYKCSLVVSFPVQRVGKLLGNQKYSLHPKESELHHKLQPTFGSILIVRLQYKYIRGYSRRNEIWTMI